MPIAAFTFGSFGDILALIDLAIQVHTALSSSAGASEDYQALVSELHSFSQLLQNVQTIHTLLCHGLNRDPPPVSLQNAIRFALERSKVLLDAICAKIAGYQKSLRRDGSGNMMKDSWRKIGWAIFKKDEIKEMRRRLGDCTQSITAHMSVSQSYSLAGLEQISRENGVTLSKLLLRMESLPKVLGYSWEGGSNSDNRAIILFDMLGQNVTIPYQFCITKEDFDGLLKLYFKHQVGRAFVDRGDYDLTSTGTESFVTPIDSKQWNASVKPGRSLYMNAVLRRALKDNGPRKCPSCQQSVHSSAIVEPDVSVQCTRCYTWFTVTESQTQDAPRYARTEFPGPFGEISQHSPTRSLGSSNMARDYDKDLFFLRRVRILEPPPIRSASNQLTIDATPLEGAIACTCGDTNRVGLTIGCATCSRWYHISCIDLQVNGQASPSTASWRCWVCSPRAQIDIAESARITDEKSDDDTSQDSTKTVTDEIAGGFPLGFLRENEIQPGRITYTTSTSHDGKTVYYPFKAVSASYQTVNGIVNGIQWIPTEATSAVPPGAVRASEDFEEAWKNTLDTDRSDEGVS